MKVLDRGHRYLVRCYTPEGTPDGGEEILQFFKRIGERYPGNEGVPEVGTNCQELLRVLIDRALYLNGQIPCPQTIRIIELLRTALYLFEYRAAEQKDKLVKFFRMPNVRSDLVGFEAVPACPACGHVYPHSHIETVSSRGGLTS